MWYSTFIAVNISGKSKVILFKKWAKHKNFCKKIKVRNWSFVSNRISINQGTNDFIFHNIEERMEPVLKNKIILLIAFSCLRMQ